LAHAHPKVAHGLIPPQGHHADSMGDFGGIRFPAVSKDGLAP